MSQSGSATVPPEPDLLLPGQHAAPEGPVDLINMYVMHHAFRRDLTAFRTAVAAASATDRDRWSALQRRWRIFATALHHHHAAEDAGLWPLLLERVTAASDHPARAVLEAMQAEHAGIDPILQQCEAAFSELAAGGDVGVRLELGRSLDEAWALLDGHLGHEERDAMVLVQRYLTEVEWLRVERDHFRPAYSPLEIFTMVPWSQLDLPADVQRKVLAAGGPLIMVLWRLSRGAFARLEEAAFGPSRTGLRSAHIQAELGQVHTAVGPLDLSAIYVLHHGFRRDLHDISDAVRRLAPDAADVWSALSRRWQQLTTAVHHHERVEDNWIWPPLLERLAAVSDNEGHRTVVAMSGEHARIDDVMIMTAQAFRAQAVRPGRLSQQRVVAAVDRTSTLLLAHLAAEETEVIPLVQRHLSPQQWRASQRRAAAEYGLRDLAFTVPWSAHEIPTDQFHLAFAHGGPLVRLLLALTRKRFEREHRRAFGRPASSPVAFDRRSTLGGAGREP